MGLITKIEPVPRIKRRVTVYLDDEPLGSVSNALAREHGLKEGMELTDEAWQAITLAEVGPALDLALYYLGLKARTEQEMAAYLKRRKYAPQVIAAVMGRLCDYKYIDDESVAQRAVESLSRQRMGRGAIERKLRQRGVDKELAKEALDAYQPEDESENARQIARTLWEKYRNDEPRKRRQKTSAALARRGFSWDSIHSAMQGLGQEMDEEAW